MQDSKCSTEKSYCSTIFVCVVEKFCLRHGKCVNINNITLLAWETLAPKKRIKCLDLAKHLKLAKNA